MTTVRDLTLGDVGKWVQFCGREARIQGRLTGFEVVTDWIEDVRLDGVSRECVPGTRRATIAVGPWTATDIPLDTVVVVSVLP